MKIGIIVYSLTGHTLSVARKVKDQLAAGGHAVTLEQIEIEGPATPQNEGAALKTRPATEPYDALLFGTPVRGGALPPPLKRYLEGIETLAGKPAAMLVTGFFPFQWGRSQVTAQLKAVLEAKGGRVICAASVGWFNLRRRADTRLAVQTLAACFDQSR